MGTIEDVNQLISIISSTIRNWKSYKDYPNEQLLLDFKQRYLKSPDSIRLLYTSLYKSVNLPIDNMFKYNNKISNSLKKDMAQHVKWYAAKDFFLITTSIKQEEIITDPVKLLETYLDRLLPDLSKRYGGKKKTGEIIFTVAYNDLLFDALARISTMDTFRVNYKKMIDVNLKYLKKSVNSWYTWFNKDIVTSLVLGGIKVIKDDYRFDTEKIDDVIEYSGIVVPVIQDINFKRYNFISQSLINVVKLYDKAEVEVE